MDNKVHHFAAGGLYNGLILLWDRETGTYWDHITGEAVYGPLAGQRLDVWYVSLTTARAVAAEHPETVVFSSRFRSVQSFVFSNFVHRMENVRGKGFLPPGFRETMVAVDDRLPEMTQGLGVFAGEVGRFYPLQAIADGGIEDVWLDRPVRVAVNPADRIPYAVWTDTGERPMQLLSRWYGFVLTFPQVEVFGVESSDGITPVVR